MQSTNDACKTADTANLGEFGRGFAVGTALDAENPRALDEPNSTANGTS